MSHKARRGPKSPTVPTTMSELTTHTRKLQPAPRYIDVLPTMLGWMQVLRAGFNDDGRDIFVEDEVNGRDERRADARSDRRAISERAERPGPTAVWRSVRRRTLAWQDTAAR